MRSGDHITSIVYCATTFVNYSGVSTSLVLNAPSQSGLAEEGTVFSNIKALFHYTPPLRITPLPTINGNSLALTNTPCMMKRRIK